MELKYVGPRPIISEHGISFKDGKDDKYVYLSNAIQILDAINHNYDQSKVYHHDIINDELGENEIMHTLLTYQGNLNDIIYQEVESYQHHLEEEQKELKKTHPLLKPLELDAFKNNLEIMKSYRVQRAINKIYYMHTIQIIADLIRKHRIKDINTPFNERFWHILQTVQGELANGKESIQSDLLQNEENIIELKIKIY